MQIIQYNPQEINITIECTYKILYHCTSQSIFLSHTHTAHKIRHSESRMTNRNLVVHCKHSPYDVYIGRASKSAPKGASGEWGNPFAMKNKSSAERTRVCEAYKAWILSQPELIAKAKRDLKGKSLGCYCSPLDCHGHILADIANNSEENDEKSSTVDNKQEMARIPPTPHPNSLNSVVENQKSGIYSSSTGCLVDIGINVHNKQMLKSWRQQIQRAYEANVTTVILTGTSIKCSSNSLELVEKFQNEKPLSMDMSLYCTVGIHPHDAKTFQENTINILRTLLQHPLAVAVGECGLDYNRNFSTPAKQRMCFEEHVKLACDIKKPLFVHEREAHEDLVAILNKYSSQLPPVVIHCFTGTAEEALAYISMGFYIGLTGTICKFERGKTLRALLPSVPLHRIMLETDAPFMGFVKGRRESEPKDVVLIADKIAEILLIDVEIVRTITTQNARTFFNLCPN